MGRMCWHASCWMGCVGVECVGMGNVSVRFMDSMQGGSIEAFVTPAESRPPFLGVAVSPAVKGLLLSLLLSLSPWYFRCCLVLPVLLLVSQSSAFCTYRLHRGPCNISLWRWRICVPGASTCVSRGVCVSVRFVIFMCAISSVCLV